MDKIKAAVGEIREFCEMAQKLKMNRQILADIEAMVNRYGKYAPPNLCQQKEELETVVRNLETRCPDNAAALQFRAQLLQEMTTLCDMLRISVALESERPVRVRGASSESGSGTRRPWQYHILKRGQVVAGRDLLNIGLRLKVPVIVRTRGVKISVPREMVNWIKDNPGLAQSEGLSFEENTED